jgi:hypothetical protein
MDGKPVGKHDELIEDFEFKKCFYLIYFLLLEQV